MVQRPLPLLLLLALAYLVSGRLGLLLAIPPGFATALFPPAGLALAAIIRFGWPALPGIWLGSFLMNLSISGPTGGWPDGFSVLIASVLAVGAALQALAGRWLLQRWLGLPLQWDDERNLLRFALLSAVGTTVAATIAIGTLRLSDRILAGEAPYSWLTWWVGDSIGVLLVTPLLLLWWAPVQTGARQQLRAIGLPITVTFILVTLLFIRASDWENQQLIAQFQNRVGQIERSIRREFDRHQTRLQQLERFYAASSDVSAEEFAEFTRDLAAPAQGAIALSNVRIVRGDERLAFEQKHQREGDVSFRIWQRNVQGEKIPATERARYFPVNQIEPARNHWLRGFDNGAEPLRRAAIEQSLRTGVATSSARLWLQQSSEAKSAVLLVQPVQKPDSRDLVVAAIQIEAAVEHALSELPHQDIAIRLFDRTASDQVNLKTGATSGSELYNSNPALTRIDSAYSHQVDWHFGDRLWQLQLHAGPSYFAKQHSWQAWLVLVAGMLFTGLIGAMLMLVHGRAMKVQQLVEQRTAELSRQQHTLQTISDSAADAILLLNERGCIEMVNPAAENLLQQAAVLLHGQPLAKWLPNWQSQWLTEAEAVGIAGVRRETPLRPATGSVRHVEIALTAMPRNGEHRYCCLLHDLTERIAVERLKRDFVATVSHELRTPLTSIRGALALLRNLGENQARDQRQQLLKMAEDNSKRLLLLVNDLLDFEKLELGKLEVSLQPVAITPLLQRSIDEMIGFALAQGVTLQLDSPLPEDFQLQLDADRFAQIMNNLLSNAIKFSPRGAAVQVSAEWKTPWLRIAVRDQGIGIPANKQHQIFQKFWQADASASRRHAGTGLGLAISKGLAEAMAGRIGFDSLEGQGSTFWVEFPLPTLVDTGTEQVVTS